uniref:Glucose-1-phosphate cytidylyltransferase n=1 Tax=Magnetococcus massalia (strain MO-1) TaxID=451514 RepID=A0A1S7LI64_MAGMO|nr:Glucose-1-phosphate cytidylyltransferase [Candidatus Magnetococcus massalia]
MVHNSVEFIGEVVDMQVVILCGGLGTRLREETEFRPKPMVPIGNRPILWHIMKYYASFGFKEFVLALGYKGESIKEYFLHYELMNSDITVSLGQPSRYEIHNGHPEDDWTISLIHTGESALKGARLKRLERYIKGDRFMVTYGDGLADLDLAAQQRFHQQHGRLATVTGVNLASRFGRLKTAEDGRVSRFFEKPHGAVEEPINGGFFIFERGIFDYLSDDDRCDLERGALERVTEAGELVAYPHPGFWACMDTLRDQEYLNQLWQQDEAPWKRWS